MKKIKTIELFAGVGGFRVGLEKASKSFDIIWSNQYEPSTKMQHASLIYEKVFGKKGHTNKDISKISVSEVPEHDLLVGGFPCQNYSIASTLKASKGIVGKKGVLWWEIYRILNDKRPKYILLENVDRLLKSPANQRGKDFAIILSSLNNLGYGVEWRVINSSDYGMPQRRRRVFIFATKVGTEFNNILKSENHLDILNDLGLFAKAFPIEEINEDSITFGKLDKNLVNITNEFNKKTPKDNAFWEAGFMINGQYVTSRVEAKYKGEISVIRDFLEDESDVDESFYIDEESLKKWKYLKGAKTIERVHKATGTKYTFSEGKMGFPDSLDKPSRTIITGEGGSGASRFKHVIFINGRHRRLTPIELERLNMFSDNHTKGVSDSKRAFLMGNALVVGIVEILGKYILEKN